MEDGHAAATPGELGRWYDHRTAASLGVAVNRQQGDPA
jgi:hypothetical protein